MSFCSHWGTSTEYCCWYRQDFLDRSVSRLNFSSSDSIQGLWGIEVDNYHWCSSRLNLKILKQFEYLWFHTYMPLCFRLISSFWLFFGFFSWRNLLLLQVFEMHLLSSSYGLHFFDSQSDSLSSFSTISLKSTLVQEFSQAKLIFHNSLTWSIQVTNLLFFLFLLFLWTKKSWASWVTLWLLLFVWISHVWWSVYWWFFVFLYCQHEQISTYCQFTKKQLRKAWDLVSFGS